MGLSQDVGWPQEFIAESRRREAERRRHNRQEKDEARGGMRPNQNQQVPGSCAGISVWGSRLVEWVGPGRSVAQHRNAGGLGFPQRPG